MLGQRREQVARRPSARRRERARRPRPPRSRPCRRRRTTRTCRSCARRGRGGSGPATSIAFASRSARRPRLVRLVDQPLAVEEAERQLLVVAGRPHRHRDRPAVDADLERLLDGDLVLEAVVADAPVHPRIHQPESLDVPRRIASGVVLRKPTKRPTPSNWASLKPLRDRRAAAEQLRRGLPRRLGEPRQRRLRLADPQRGRLRRLRARHERAEGLDDPRRPPLQHPPAAAAAEHDGAARSRRGSPTSRRCAACAATSCGRSAGCPSRCSAATASPASRRISWDEALDLAAERIARRRPGPLRLLPDQPRDVERELLRRPEGGPRDRHELDRQRRPRLPLAEHVRAQGRARRRRDDLLLHATGSAPTSIVFIGSNVGQQPAGRDEVPARRQEGRARR